MVLCGFDYLVTGYPSFRVAVAAGCMWRQCVGVGAIDVLVTVGALCA